MNFERHHSLILFVLAFAVISGLSAWGYLYQRQTHFTAGTNPILSEKPAVLPAPVLPPIRVSDPIRGSDAANSVVIVEFGDYFTGETRALEVELKKVLSEQRVPVRLVWRDYYSASDQPGYAMAALAAHCAGEQGKFWDMHDALFTETTLDYTTFTQLASDMIGDYHKFDTCLSSGKYLKTIGSDVALEEMNNIVRSPTLFINGKAYVGYQTADKINTLIYSASQ